MMKLLSSGVLVLMLPMLAFGGEEIVSLAKEKGRRLGVDPYYVLSVVNTESKGIPDARSSAGAVGLMQLMPRTAEFMGVDRNALTNPERNMEAGIRYLSRLKRLFNGDLYLMAAAYNAGEGAVKKYGGIPPYRETRNYVPTVMERYWMLKRCGLDCYTKEYMNNPGLFWQKNSLVAYKKKEQVSNQNVFLAWAGIEQTKTHPKSGKVQEKFEKPKQEKVKNEEGNRAIGREVVNAVKVKEDSFVTTLSDDGKTYVSVDVNAVR